MILYSRFVYHSQNIWLELLLVISPFWSFLYFVSNLKTNYWLFANASIGKSQLYDFLLIRIAQQEPSLHQGQEAVRFNIIFDCLQQPRLAHDNRLIDLWSGLRSRNLRSSRFRKLFSRNNAKYAIYCVFIRSRM